VPSKAPPPPLLPAGGNGNPGRNLNGGGVAGIRTPKIDGKPGSRASFLAGRREKRASQPVRLTLPGLADGSLYFPRFGGAQTDSENLAQSFPLGESRSAHFLAHKKLLIVNRKDLT
jgi:hypothetical protein